jgi:hypothetical protein
MAYKVDKFNGTFLVNVADGSIDTTTDLRFIGKNYAGYGEVQNENFLHLLENFANTSPPPRAQLGQIWYDSTSTVKKIKFWDGSQWKVASGALPQGTPPAGLSPGELWLDTTTNQVSVWTGTGFVLVGPENTPELESTTSISDIVKDTSGVNHTILRIIVEDSTVMVFSNTEFTLSSIYPWAQGKFSLIKKGATLAGPTSSDGVTSLVSDFSIFGTASSAKGITGPNNEFLNHTQFVRQGQRNLFADSGLFIGDGSLAEEPSPDLRIFIDLSSIPVFENRNFTEGTNSLVFRIRTGPQLAEKKDSLIVSRNSVYPGVLDRTVSLGTTTNRWGTVWADTFTGNLIGNVTGNTFGVHKGDVIDDTNVVRFDSSSGEFFGNLTGNVIGNITGNATTATSATTVAGLDSSEGADPNTVVLRTSSGDIVANRFIGIASKADELLVGTEYRSASVSQVPNTVVARDSNADITARIFNGTATSAQYADLAEKYLPDVEYEPGTVVSIGGEKEITASSWGKRAIGVISTAPAYMMNSELEGGVYVALKGRVPVKVIGRIKKGEDLIAANNGCAMMAVPHASNVFAVALESSDDEGIKTIEALIL